MNIHLGVQKQGLATAHSAKQAFEIANEIRQQQRSEQVIREQYDKQNETLVAGAEADIAQKELFEQQLDMMCKQNDLLFDNYSMLKELYDAQVQTNKEAKEELKRSKRFNIAMMIIAIIAMVAAIAGPIATILVSQ